MTTRYYIAYLPMGEMSLYYNGLEEPLSKTKADVSFETFEEVKVELDRILNSSQYANQSRYFAILPLLPDDANLQIQRTTQKTNHRKNEHAYRLASYIMDELNYQYKTGVTQADVTITDLREEMSLPLYHVGLSTESTDWSINFVLIGDCGRSTLEVCVKHGEQKFTVTFKPSVIDPLELQINGDVDIDDILETLRSISRDVLARYGRKLPEHQAIVSDVLNLTDTPAEH